MFAFAGAPRKRRAHVARPLKLCDAICRYTAMHSTPGEAQIGFA
jgi:hypothetical protein